MSTTFFNMQWFYFTFNFDRFICRKEKGMFDLLIDFFICNMLGWNSYFFKANSIPSEIPSVLDNKSVFSTISRDFTAFTKKQLNFSDISLSSDKISLLSTRVTLLPFWPLLVKNGLTVFQNFLLSVIFLWSRLTAPSDLFSLFYIFSVFFLCK